MELRWLAEECGLPTAPRPHLVSQLIGNGPGGAAAIAHAAWWSRNANAAGNFAQMTRNLADASDAQRVAALAALGYDGLLYYEDETIIANFFFQRHGNEMHAFSGWTHERVRGRGLLLTATLDFIAHAHAAGAPRVRVGATDGALQRRLWAHMQRVAERRGWRLRAGGWLDF